MRHAANGRAFLSGSLLSIPFGFPNLITAFHTIGHGLGSLIGAAGIEADA